MTKQRPQWTDDKPVGGTSSLTATWLVAIREIKAFLRVKGFWIALCAMVAGLFASTLLPSLFSGDAPSVASVGPGTSRAVQTTNLDSTEVSDVATAEEMVRAEEVDAAIVPDGRSATGLRVIALDDEPTGVVSALSTAPPVDLLEPGVVDSGTRMLVSMVFGFVFMLFGMGGMAIAQSTVTEKQTRIVEILVATVPVRALLAGKIVGHVLLTLGQVVVLAVAAPIALRLGGHGALLAVLAPALGWFIPFMIFGFVLLASMWAIAGSLVSRQEDLGSTTPLITMLVMAPYFLVLPFGGNHQVMGVLSYVPFSAPVAAPLRLFQEQAQVWEAVVSLGILAATAFVMLLLSSRVYSGSLLHTRGKVSFGRAWRRAE